MGGDGVAGATIGAVGAEGANRRHGAGASVVTFIIIRKQARVGARLARYCCQVQEHDRRGSAHHLVLGAIGLVRSVMPENAGEFGLALLSRVKRRVIAN